MQDRESPLAHSEQMRRSSKGCSDGNHRVKVEIRGCMEDVVLQNI